LCHRHFKLFSPIGILLVAVLLGACKGKEQGTAPAPGQTTVESKRQHEVQKVFNDGNPSGQTDSNSILSGAKNSPPEVVSVKLAPDLVFPGTPLKAEVEATDPDRDPVTLEYEWQVNGDVISGQAMDEFDTGELRKGDLVAVTVTPFDGQVNGDARDSHPVVILNRSPEITSFPPSNLTDGVFTYEVTATDPDGDTLQFSLEKAPPGMSINADTGRIDWRVPADLFERFQVRIAVSDQDARAFQEFSLNLQKGDH